MFMYTDEQIIEKANEIAKMISDTSEVERFKAAEANINGNEKVQKMMKQIKFLQKEAVNCQHYGKTEALARVEAKLDKLFAELDEMPVVQQFQESQEEVNGLLQYVTVTISNGITDQIIEATDGDVLAGKTGSGMDAENKSGGCGY